MATRPRSPTRAVPVRTAELGQRPEFGVDIRRTNHGRADRPGAFDPLSVLKGFGSILGPATLATALAFYFGWERTNVLLQYFGVDSSLVSFSAQDYLLRGIDGVFTPLVLTFSVALFGLALHTVMLSIVRRRRHLAVLKALGFFGIGVGVVLFGEGLGSAVIGSILNVYYLIPPLSLGAGVIAISYGVYMLLQVQTPNAPQLPGWLKYGLVFSAFSLVALSLFWTTSIYAQAVGRGRAIGIASGLAGEPEAVVYSQDRLGIEDTGSVSETAIGDAHSKYRYRYGGLRLLLKSDGKYFLLPADWQQRRGPVVTLSDSDSIRLTFVTVR